MRRFICIPAIIICTAFQLIAQTGDIRGFVYDKATGEPVIFTNVIIKGTGIGAATDVNGFFSIADVKTGDYIIQVTNIEYDTLEQSIILVQNEIENLKLYLKKANRVLNTFTVSGVTQEKATEIRISTIPITPKQIERLPSVGGEPDIAQYLQVLPGVIFTGDQGGQLYIRGGSPIQNKVLLDGMVIYNPFHSIGLFSVFETDIIRSVDVYTGGFNGEYGDRISAIVDITTRDGNKNETDGEISFSPFIGRGRIEGPLKKGLSSEESSITYLLTVKHSYLNKTSPVLYSYVNDSIGIPYSFTDVYGKLSFNSPTGSKLNLFAFNFRDSVAYSSITQFNWNTIGGGGNFVIVPEASNVLIEGVFAYSDYKITQSEADEKPRNSEVGGFNGGVDFTYYIPEGEIKYGFEVVGFKTDYSFFNRLEQQYENTQFTTELGGFFKFRKVYASRFVFEPSVRFQYYSSLSEFSPEPRLGMKYNISERFRIKVAGGLYSQNLISSKSDKDIVNLFSGYLSGPDDDLYSGDGSEVTSHLQKSTHAIFGIEIDATKFIEINIEPYIKYFNQLIEINRNKSIPSDPDFATETGQASGIDFSLKYDYKKLYIWTAYSLGFITRNDGEQIYPPHYDRRHNMNIVSTYTFGKENTWEASARWNFGSGFPFTQTAGFYEYIDFFDGISTDYTTTNGTLGIIYDDELNGGRLPTYHRLDVSVKKQIQINEKSKLDITWSITNVYNRENIFYFDRIRYERVNQLPILPAVSVSYGF